MTKYLAIALIYIYQAYANDVDIKNDNTIQVQIDDFITTVEYPKNSNNSKELTLIIRNRSNVQFFFSLKRTT